jgi:hypothetical protein
MTVPSSQDFQNSLPRLVFLEAMAHEDPTAANELLPLVYRELQNPAVFKNTSAHVITLRLNSNPPNSSPFLGSISRINGWMIELP